jgi:hypothetical protein
VTLFKGTKFEDIEDASVIWMGQVNVKNGTATDEVIKEEVKAVGQQMTNWLYKHWY